MRRLHAVARHERFRASGQFTQYQNGQATGLVEHWTIHEVSDGLFIRVDHDARDYDGSSVLIEALRGPDGSFERIDLHRYESGQSRPLRLSCEFDPEFVEIIRGGGQISRFARPSKSAVWLGGWLLLGLVLKPEVQQLLSWRGESFDTMAVIYQGLDTRTEAARQAKASYYHLGETMTLSMNENQVPMSIEMDGGIIISSQRSRRA